MKRPETASKRPRSSSTFFASSGRSDDLRPPSDAFQSHSGPPGWPGSTSGTEDSYAGDPDPVAETQAWSLDDPPGCLVGDERGGLPSDEWFRPVVTITETGGVL